MEAGKEGGRKGEWRKTCRHRYLFAHVHRKISNVKADYQD